jgi:hypothetical protein
MSTAGALGVAGVRSHPYRRVTRLIARTARVPATVRVGLVLVAALAALWWIRVDLEHVRPSIWEQLAFDTLVLLNAGVLVAAVLQLGHYLLLTRYEDELVQLVVDHFDAWRASPELVRLVRRHAQSVGSNAQPVALAPLLLVPLFVALSERGTGNAVLTLLLLFLGFCFLGFTRIFFATVVRSALAAIVLRGIIDYEEPAARQLALDARERAEVRRLLRHTRDGAPEQRRRRE